MESHSLKPNWLYVHLKWSQCMQPHILTLKWQGETLLTFQNCIASWLNKTTFQTSDFERTKKLLGKIWHFNFHLIFEMQTESTSPENATLVQLVRPKIERKKGKVAFLNSGRKRYEISLSIRMNTHLCVHYKYNIYSCFQLVLSKLIVNDLKVSTYKWNISKITSTSPIF